MTDVVTTSSPPKSFSTRSLTLYTPGSAYVNVGFWAVESKLASSVKSQPSWSHPATCP